MDEDNNYKFLMFAIVQVGGAQHKIDTGSILYIPKMDRKKGEKFSLGQVISYYDGKSLVSSKDGLKKISVNAEVLGEGRGDKIIVFKKKRRKDYKRKHGHRQDFTKLKITEISER